MNKLLMTLQFLKMNSSFDDTPQHDARYDPLTTISTEYKHNWRNIFVIGGIIIVGGWIFLNSNGGKAPNMGGSYMPQTPKSISTNSPKETTSANEDNVIVGKYSCTNYHYSRADDIKPSTFTEQQLIKLKMALDSDSQKLELIKRRIDSISVDNTNQVSIDNFNAKVDSYNLKLQLYKSSQAEYNDKVDNFNFAVNNYNNYLLTNCTKRS